ncbi:MAG: ATP-dependent DNA ligase [Acidimicrobiia bacterium]
MLLAEIVATSAAVGATRSRTAKVAALADLLARVEPEQVAVAVGFLVGEARQGRIGVGWAQVRDLDVAPAPVPAVTVAEVDTALDRLAATTGAGSVGARRAVLQDLFGRATAAEGDFLRRLLLGEIRQGALAGLMADAVARAAGVPLALVRRAAMLSGDLGATAALARTGGAAGLEAVGLTVGRPVLPMLAATATDVADALDRTGPASVEWKLDGARVQVHRSGRDVAVFTRNLNEVTDRLPGIVSLARALPGSAAVLDGEVVGLDDEARPHAFQDTMSAFGRQDAAGAGEKLAVAFFDVLHLDGTDVLDEPLSARRALLEGLVGPRAVPATVTADAAEAQAFLDGALAGGHEGVMVKALDAPYEAGRRGGSWRKVKPVRTLDLVVLAAEWGHGRRRGWLSNLHLGARDPAGGFVMVGKTFKGLTDEVLARQTAAFLDREVGRDGIVVHVRPELVVEVALDGVQASTRYHGGVALRFARVRAYRPDKTPAEADTIDDVRALLPRPR